MRNDTPARAGAVRSRPVRLAYLVSHPIQYQVPLLRRIAREPDIELTVFFGSDFSVRGYQDAGFGVDVKWDVPLLGGYRHEFLPVLRAAPEDKPLQHISRGIFDRLRGRSGEPQFDVLWVHGYNTPNALHGMLAAKALGIPVLLRAESWLGDRLRPGWKLAAKSVFFRMLRGLTAGTLPIGTLNEEYWSRYLGVEFPRWRMPYAVDNDYFQERCRAAEGERQALRQELQLEEGRPVILFCSKLQGRKNCGDLLTAYVQLSDTAEPWPYLVIVGDGEERSALESRAAATGWNSIRFTGFKNQSELPRYFDLATVFVLPSRHEPWGLIVNEVMNAGRAVILSGDVGCQPDLVKDGDEGFVFATGDVPALTRALRRVLETPRTASEMGSRALERIRTWSFEEDVTALRRALAATTGRIVA